MTGKENWFETRYFLKGKLFASRFKPYAPVVGDEVKLKTGIYQVTYRIWIENGESMWDYHCAVDIKEVKL